MTQRSRRSMLMGSLGVAATLSGCSSFVDVTGESDGRGAQYSRLAVEQSLSRPFVSPFKLPRSLFQAHADRIESLLGAVPTEPDVPNEVIRTDISARREGLVQRFEEVQSVGRPNGAVTDGDTPADSTGSNGDGSEDGDGTMTPQRRLGELRELRRAAAELRGTYRAATGRFEAGEMVTRRDRRRTGLAEFRAGWEYRGPDPMTAVVVHTEFEYDVARIEHELTPWPQVPDRPLDEPERVGYLAGKVETATALLEDLRTLKQRAVPQTGPTYRPALMATGEWLGRRARRAGIDIEDAPRRGREVLDRELGESSTGALFDAAVEAYDNHSERNAPQGPAADNYAGSVIGAATQRAAVTAAAQTVAAIRDGLTVQEPSATLVDRRRTGAREGIQTALDSGPTAFTAPTLGAAYRALRDANDSLQSKDGAAALGRFTFAQRVAEIIPDVVNETQFLLSQATD